MQRITKQKSSLGIIEANTDSIDAIPDEYSDQENRIESCLSKQSSLCKNKFLIFSKQRLLNEEQKKTALNKDNQHRKLTHGLKSYKDIKMKHQNKNFDKDNEKKQVAIASKKEANKQINVGSNYREEKQCTFTPKINPSSKDRTFRQFVKSQEKFLIKKQEKIHRIKEQIKLKQSASLTYMPSIDRNSKKILHNAEFMKSQSIAHQFLDHSMKKSAHQRLYEKSRQKDQRSYEKQQHSFTPKICSKSKNLIRAGKVENLLYEDAKRRQQQTKFMQNQGSRKQLLLIPKSPHNIPTKQRTNKLVCNKIRSQFLQLLQVSSDSESIYESVPQILVLAVLSQIFNVELNPNTNEYLCKKVLEVFYSNNNGNSISSSLSVSQINYVDTGKLWQFIRIITIGLDGYAEQKNLFSQPQAKQIWSEFGYFYSSRLSKWQNKNGDLVQELQQKTDQRIEISATTHRLAQIHRTKKVQKINEFLTQNRIFDHIDASIEVQDDRRTQLKIQKQIKLHDLFILDEIRKKAELEKIRLQKEEDEIKKFPFKPQISSYEGESKRSLAKNQISQHKTVKKCQVGMKDHSGSNSKPRRIVIKGRILQKKNTQENNDNGLINSCKNIKNVDKMLLRLSLGRKQKQAEAYQKERGYNCSKNKNWLKEAQTLKKQVLSQISNFLGFEEKRIERNLLKTQGDQTS